MYPEHTLLAMKLSPKRKRLKTGFTLIELLVVMAIIVIISSFVLVALGGDDGTRAVNNSIRRVDATFSLARTAATSRKTTTRVLVDYNPASANYLRSVQIFYLNGDTGQWEAFSEPEVFPSNVVMNTPLSGNSQVRFWQATIDPVTYAVSSPGDTLLPAASPGANQWIAYEFRPNGTATFPMSRFVVSRGFTASGQANPTGVVVTTSAGFVLFRSGKAVYFKDHNHIQAN